MKTSQTLQSFSDIKTLSDPRRLAIVQLLMATPATLTQLGQSLDLSPARVRHHLKILEASGFVELVETRAVRGFTAKYYQATAQAYFINNVVLPQNESDSVFVIGSHDLALELLADHLEQSDQIPRMITVPVGSLDGLLALRSGHCQITGCHLYDPIGGEYNTSYVRHIFPGQSMNVFTLAHRKQGLVVAAGNPLEINGLDDLIRPEITFINRKSGSGTRLWLDQELCRLDLAATQIKGFANEVGTHLQVAAAVGAGIANVGLAVFAAAEVHRLDFIPLFEERFDLVLPTPSVSDPHLIPLFETLNSQKFQNRISGLAGYRTTKTGQEIRI
jgi:putative molybdopterin biosynthesis protein